LKQLLDNLDVVSDGPQGVKSLREAVLRLAISGKLVAQRPSDGTGEQLLKKIWAERGIIRTVVPGSSIPIPDSWARARLDEFVHLEMGQSPDSASYNQKGDGIPFYQGKSDFGPLTPTPRHWCSDPKKVALPGDVLLSVRAPVGPTNYVTEDSCIGRGLAALRPFGGVQTEFILWWMRAIESEIARMGTGTTFVAVSKRDLAPFVISVPPLEEQKRIVAKVEELMALCDQLEAKLKVRSEVAEKFARSILDGV